VIARGFPIPKRPEEGTGVEIPLDVMAALADGRYINSFQSKIYMKGFSTMLVPTKKSGDTLVWHLLYNDRPKSRISYLDCGMPHANVTLGDLEQSRHIVGWCSDVSLLIGELLSI
jgi:hypothetical protein